MPVDKLSIEQFAQRVKAKYPQYKDVNDSVLVEKMVSKYPEYKDKVNIGQPQQSQQAQPSPQQESFKPMSDWLSIPQAAQPMVADNKVDNHKRSVMEASERVNNELTTIDPHIKNLLYETKKDVQGRVKSQQLGLNPREAGPANQQAAALESKLRIEPEVTAQEVEQFKSEMPTNVGMLRTALDQKVKDLLKTDPVKANKIKSDVYRLDSQDRVANSSKIEKNAEKLDKGELDYDTKRGVLVKPQGFFGSLATGFKQKNQLFKDYELYKSDDQAAVIKDLNKKMMEHDPDDPIPTPDGALGEAGAVLGGTPIKPIVGGIAASYVTSPLGGATAAAGISAHEMYKLGYAGALPQNYAAIKSENPSLTDEQAYEQARALTEKQAYTDAAVGAATGFVGIKGGLAPSVGTSLLQKSVGSALRQLGKAGVEKGLEGLAVGVAGAGGQVVKNMMAQKAGIDVATDEGVMEQLKMGVGMTMGMAIAAKSSKLLKPSTYNKLFHSLSKLPEEAVTSELNKLQEVGYITPEEAQQTQLAIKKQGELDAAIPDGVTESERLKIQDKIKQRDELNAQLEKSDAAFHPEIKEKVKALNEEIVNISKGGAKGELQKLVSDEAKNLEGYTAEPLLNASEKELKTYFKDIADQANDPATAQLAIETFGENIVNKAKQLNPRPVKEQIQSLFDGTKSTMEIVEGISQHVDDEFLQKQVDHLLPYLKENPDIKFSKMFTVGRAQAMYTGDWTVLLSHIKDNKQLLNTVVHELYHNISINKLVNDEAFNSQIEALRTEAIDKLGVKDYLDGAQNTDFGFTKDKKYYGLLDNKEFIAELFSNKEFNEMLDGIKPEGKKSILDKFVDKLKSIVGIKDPSYTDKVKKSILEGIDKKIELSQDETLKGMVDAYKNAARESDFQYNPLEERVIPEPEAVIIEEKPKSNVSVIQPEEVKRPETITIKPKEVEPVVQEPTVTVESEPAPQTTTPVGEPEMIGITHAEMDRVSRELGLPEYTKDPETFASWTKEAREKMAKDPEALNNLINKLRNGEAPNGVETQMMKMHFAALKDKYNSSPTPELLAEIKRTKDLYNVSGREAGKTLAARKGLMPVEDTLSDYHMTDIDFNKGAKLTEKQLAQSTKEFNEISAAKNALEQKVAKLEEASMRAKAEKKIQEEAKAAKKDGKKDYKTERKEILKNIGDKWKKSSKENLGASFVPYAKELAAIAPDVMKLVRNLVEEGVEKLPDVIKSVHKQIKDLIPDITEKDVHDIIAGEYNKKQTRNQIQEQLYDLRKEAKLMNELEQLENGEVPKDEKRQRRRNQRIEELRSQIKELKDEMGLNDRTDADKLASLKGRYKTKIKELEDKIAKGDYAPDEKPQPIELDEEGKQLRDKYLELKEQRAIRLLEQEYSNRSTAEKVGGVVSKALKTGRTLQSSFDVSYPFRQTIVGLSRELFALPFTKKNGSWKFDGFKSQKQLADQFGKMYRSFGSEKTFRAVMDEIHNNPNYEKWQKAGLEFTDPLSALDQAKEEMFQGSYAENIPVLSKGVKASHRAATVIANKMKWDIVNELAAKFEEQGKTFENSPELYEATAKYANQLVGRGALGEKMSNAAPVIAHFVYSLRLYASRLQLLTYLVNPKFYTKVPKEIRVEYLKDMTKFLALGGTVMGLASAAGLKVGLNPYDSDFGSIIAGDTRYDVWGGFKQYAVLLSRIVAGKATSEKDLRPLFSEDEGDSRQKSRGDILLRFLRTKASPELGAVINVTTGKDFMGKPVTVKSAAKDYFTPLLYKDVIDVYKDKGVDNALLTLLLASHGVGVQTQKPREVSVSNRGGSTRGKQTVKKRSKNN